MDTITVASKEVRDIIKATFPDYRKRKVVIQASRYVTFRDLNWSGGTRAEYQACTIDGRPYKKQYDMSAPPPWENPFEGRKIELPEDVLIVEGGYFCGKKRQLWIHVHPNNMPKLLPDRGELK